MKFENLFYHGTSVGVGSHNPNRAIPCLSSQNEGGAQQKLGLISYPKKGFLGGQIPSFPPFSPFPPFPLTLKARDSFHFPPFPLSLKAHGNFHFPHFPLSLKAYGNFYFPRPPTPRPPNSESTWKHAVFPHFPPTLKAHGNMPSSPIPPLS
jgi:hypothetical protein